MFSQQAGLMAGEGFVGACIEYRFSDEAKYPAGLDDSGAAVRWLRGHAAEYNIDPGRIGAVGGSSGGQLAGLLGTMKGRIVQAVVEFNPALDLVSLGRMPPSAVQENLHKFLGATYAENPGLWAEAAPVTHVSKDSAPFLFLHGTADTIVPYQQSIDMMNKLKAAGVPAEIFTAEGAQHGVLNSPPWFPATAKRMEEFFVKYLGMKSAGQH